MEIKKSNNTRSLNKENYVHLCTVQMVRCKHAHLVRVNYHSIHLVVEKHSRSLLKAYHVAYHIRVFMGAL